ncbi:MAG: hypothetical protein KAH21_08090, partial [Spirochaetaceae bacterium]|nr:hypothetical protein [Spirochaetaceae bacterium]
GLDFCWYDLRSHARPHSFDGWLAARSNRKNPMNNILWDRALKLAPERSGICRSGPALRTYADWFRENTPSGHVFRLTPTDSTVSAVPIPGIPDRGPEIFYELPKLKKASSYTIISSPENIGQRQLNVKNLISKWKHLLNNSTGMIDSGIRELLYTLDPGGVLELEGSSHLEYADLRTRHLERVKKIINNLDTVYD